MCPVPHSRRSMRREGVPPPHLRRSSLLGNTPVATIRHQCMGRCSRECGRWRALRIPCSPGRHRCASMASAWHLRHPRCKVDARFNHNHHVIIVDVVFMCESKIFLLPFYYYNSFIDIGKINVIMAVFTLCLTHENDWGGGYILTCYNNKMVFSLSYWCLGIVLM